MKINLRSPSRTELLPRSSGLPLSIIHSSILLAAIILTIAAPSRTQSLGFAENYVADTSTAVASGYSIERHVFALINEERARYGRSQLAWVERAADAARFHSNDMAVNNFFSHQDLGGKRVSARADAFGISNWRSLGENIAWLTGGTDTATRVVKLWMESPGHRENILNRSFRESGVGLSTARDGKIYITQVFILR